MPFDQMTVEQISELLEAQGRLQELPGVLYLQPEFADRTRTRLVIAVYVESQNRDTVDQLPSTIGGLPVIAKIEDVKTSTVTEVVDLQSREG